MSGSGRILLVGDDSAVLEALSAALIPTYEVFKARTGLGALEVVIHQAPEEWGTPLNR